MILKATVHFVTQIYCILYMFFFLISIYVTTEFFLLFKLDFLNRIYVFNIFLFGGAVTAKARTRFITATFLKSTLSTQWIYFLKKATPILE